MQPKINIGNLVASLHDDIKGVVILINEDKITIEDQDGFERIYNTNELIVYDDRLTQDKSKITAKNTSKKEIETAIEKGTKKAQVIHIGNAVAHIEDNIKGIVIGIHNTKITLEDEDGFERVYGKNELILYDDRLAQDKSKITKNKISKKVTKTPLKQDVKVIDLHHSNSLVNPNRILENQLKKFYLELNTAIRLKNSSIIFIHGVGKGVLQKRMEIILRKNKIKFTNASYTKYGYGAMEVFLSGATVLKQ